MAGSRSQSELFSRQQFSFFLHIAAICTVCVFTGFTVSGDGTVLRESRSQVNTQLHNRFNIGSTVTNFVRDSLDVHVPSAATHDHRRLHTHPCSSQEELGEIPGAEEPLRLSEERAGDHGKEHMNDVFLPRQKKTASTEPVYKRAIGITNTDVATGSGDELRVVSSSKKTEPQFLLDDSSEKRSLYLRPPQLPSDISAMELSTFLARLKGSPLLFYGPFDNPDEPTLVTAAALEAAAYWSKSIENLRTVLDVLYTAWEHVILLPFSIRGSRSSYLKEPSKPEPVIPSPGTPQPNPAPSPGNPQPGPSPSPSNPQLGPSPSPSNPQLGSSPSHGASRQTPAWMSQPENLRIQPPPTYRHV